jgi:hypothetical protein
MALLVYKSLHGSRPWYFTNIFTPLFIAGRLAFCSWALNKLLIPRCRLSNIGFRAFPDAGAAVRNSLPPDVASPPSINIFCFRLETLLFDCFYPGAVDVRFCSYQP